MHWNPSVSIFDRSISKFSPAYFVADVAANHDGDIVRAKELIWMAKDAGADAVKFQHFTAEKIVSDLGFKTLGNQLAHQSTWNKSVFEIYRQYECNLAWTDDLIETAKRADIHFFTTPYDFDAVNQLDASLPAYKIGSGDITWIEFISFVASKGKPVMLATGASDIQDVERAVAAVLKLNPQLILMQCNTNYTGSRENFKYINLRVLNTFEKMYPDMILGLSDHSPGHSTVLGALTLGAKVIEKHFTDDCSRTGPDHAFSLDRTTWRQMIDASRELEYAFGDGLKRVEENEKDSAIVQQRCLRLSRDMAAKERLTEADITVLRPAPPGALRPYDKESIIGASLLVAKKSGDTIHFSDLETK